jgi:hypothetical protein
MAAAHLSLAQAKRWLDPATAFRHHQDALQSASEAGYGQGEAAALIGLAQTQADLGHHADARPTTERALLATRQTGLRVREGHALTTLADTVLESGRTADAETSRVRPWLCTARPVTG